MYVQTAQPPTKFIQLLQHSSMLATCMLVISTPARSQSGSDRMHWPSSACTNASSRASNTSSRSSQLFKGGGLICVEPAPRRSFGGLKGTMKGLGAAGVWPHGLTLAWWCHAGRCKGSALPATYEAYLGRRLDHEGMPREPWRAVPTG